MLHSFQQSTVRDVPPPDIQWQADRSDSPESSTGSSLHAILEARRSLETVLVTDENWRALQQLLARETAGEWMDVVESDVLRDHLTTALAAQPAFMAWQFVDAARACLEAAQPVASGTGVTSPADAIDAAFFVVEPEVVVANPSELGVSAQTQTIRSSQLLASESAGSQLLATRIPTLQVHEKRAHETLPAPDAARYLALSAPLSDEPEILRRPSDIIASALPSDFRDRLGAACDDQADTLFQNEAAGIEEADVEIVIRQPRKQLLDARLPPLPLTNDTQYSMPRPTKAARTTAVKWIDRKDDAEPDYRPVGSALDEAQVSIIATGAKSDAQSRAERRALGIAPDRENQMRRFLSALSGDNPP